MYLKNIEVQGFKSFAQKINFEFHNGITAIVGPNGSGKSNVADAVRWVLGEQSAKQLRGGNMQDVIFSGTETRKPLSFASVAITLDNGDHELPIGYNEVTVTRRLYRSGESEYLINGSVCRLKDINEMFYDTGIGKEGYSIIGQGQIDRILSGKPEDRRELFDEAAGIVKFKRRKNSTLKKLDEERQNLVRVTDILSELTKQLGPLEKQAETARIYLAKRDELRELDVNLFLAEYERTGEQLEELEKKSALAEGELSSARNTYDQIRVEYDRLNQELTDLDQKIGSLRENTQESALKRQTLEGRIHVLEEQILSGRQSGEHYRSRLLAIGEEEQRREEEKARHEEEKSQLRAGLKKIRSRLKKEEESLAFITASVESCDQDVENGKNEIIEILNSRATTKGKAQHFDTMMEQMEVRKAEISRRLLHLQKDEQEQLEIREKADREYETVTEEIASLSGELKHQEGMLADLKEVMKRQNAQLEIGQAAYHREASRLESLRNLAERYDGYGNSIRRVMEQKERVPGLRGVVADIIQVEKDYEIAVETALGGSIQSIVTDGEQTAKEMIGFLKKNRFGRATFLPLSSVRGRGDFQPGEALREPGAVGVASSLAHTSPEYRELVSYLLGHVLVVDHIDHAIAIEKKYRHRLRIVTLEGESFSPGGSITGGAFKNSSNLLGRRREIEDLEYSVNALKKDMDDMQNAIEENRGRRNGIRDSVADLQDQISRKYVAQNTARMNLAQLEEKEQEIRNDYVRIRREQEELQRQTLDISKDHEALAKELEASQKDEKELEAFIEIRQEELDNLRAEETAKTRELEAIRLEVSTMEQKEFFEQENLSRLLSELEGLQQEKTGIHDILLQGEEDIRKKEEGIEGLKGEIAACREQEACMAGQMERYQKDKEQRAAAHGQFFEKRDELSQRIGLLDKECFRLKSQAEKLNESREARISYMWEEYEITPNSALQYKKEELKDQAAMKKGICRLKEEIRGLGSVNVNAIEDYKELLERHTFLSAQHEDLVKAEETLLGIIQELDEGMRRQFSEKFRDIQREFDKAFRELFGGGRGTLELMEEEDILEAGVRIISQPPGKKLQNMMQLSGGEKALTAIALLFAIQNLKPSPFCLLDEIEAALDDSNVGRFAAYLQKLTKNTQFIIITHRRGTMSAADRLYGITMQEKGVSALVSVDLVEHQLTG